MAGHRLEHGFKTLVLWRFCDGRRPCPKEKYQILGRRVDETIWTDHQQPIEDFVYANACVYA